LENNLITEELHYVPRFEGKMIVSDPERDILKLVVIDRHSGSNRIGKAFVKGFGLKRGALGSSVSHDSHNIIIVGVTDQDIYAAYKSIKSMKGGQVVIDKGNILASLELPIAGIISDQKADIVVEKLDKLHKAANRLSTTLHDPFMTLAFLALPVIPKLKLTDFGLIDVEKFEVTNLIIST
jgi:adenine deaminase